MSRIPAPLLGGLLLLAAAAPAPAALIVGHYEGAVEVPRSSLLPPAYRFGVGERVALDFEIDPAGLVSLGAGGYQGRSATARLATAGGFALAFDDSTRLLFLALEDGPVDRLRLLLTSSRFAASIEKLRFEDPTGSVLSSTDINTPFDLYAFGPGRLAYDRDLGLEGEGFVGEVRPVPEPSTWALALTGLGLVLLAGRPAP